MQASVVAREFTFNGVRIPDPDKSLSPEEVRSVLATLYPDIATASITGPEAVGDKLRYNFVRAIEIRGALAFFPA
jgi:PRTRC genetic system protein C